MRGSRYIGYLLGSALAAAVPAAAQDVPDGMPAVQAEVPAAVAPSAPQIETAPAPDEQAAPDAQAAAQDADPATPSAEAPPATEPFPAAEAPAPPPAEPAATAEAAEPQAIAIEAVIAERLAGSKDDADLLAFYATRAHAPIWISDGKLNAKARAAMERIRRADEDGLDPSAFILPDADATDSSPEQLAAAEIALSRAVASYARQAQGGRLVPSSLSPNITPEPTRAARGDILGVMAQNDDVADWLDSYNPPHPQFRALKAKLAELRKAEREPTPPPPEVPTARKSLRPGASDPRVPLLRERLGLQKVVEDVAAPSEGDVTGSVDSLVYDDELVAAVKTFQTRHGLNADGIVGTQTVRTMNAAAKIEDPIPLVLVNMERWRWLPRDLGATHIFVNVPEYMARIVRDGTVIHETRVITGTAKNQTPIFSDEMDHIIVNPSWNVPSSIATKEMLPNLMRDPTYLARQGIEVLYTGERRPILLDSTRVDWSRVDMRHIRFRQPPGERNALGHIKFMFPNKHAVYLHDTPSRNLFAKDARAFSHGCVRVQDPFALAGVLLEGTDFDTTKFKKMIGGKSERRIDLAHKIPIHLTYFTAEILDDGSLLTRIDIYGTDKKMKSALRLGGQVEAANHP